MRDDNESSSNTGVGFFSNNAAPANESNANSDNPTNNLSQNHNTGSPDNSNAPQSSVGFASNSNGIQNNNNGASNNMNAVALPNSNNTPNNSNAVSNVNCNDGRRNNNTIPSNDSNNSSQKQASSSLHPYSASGDECGVGHSSSSSVALASATAVSVAAASSAPVPTSDTTSPILQRSATESSLSSSGVGTSSTLSASSSVSSGGFSVPPASGITTTTNTSFVPPGASSATSINHATSGSSSGGSSATFVVTKAGSNSSSGTGSIGSINIGRSNSISISNTTPTTATNIIRSNSVINNISVVNPSSSSVVNPSSSSSSNVYSHNTNNGISTFNNTNPNVNLNSNASAISITNPLPIPNQNLSNINTNQNPNVSTPPAEVFHSSKHSGLNTNHNQNPIASTPPEDLFRSSSKHANSVNTNQNPIASTPPDEVFRSSKHASLSLERMRGFYNTGQLCDVILVAGGGSRHFPAHRLVLSAASDYFAAMFTSGLSEASQEHVNLPHVDAESMQTLLHYCYTGELEVRESSVELLLSTAHQLLMNEVVTVCCNFLASQLHPTNCIGIQLFADSQGCNSLLQAAQQYTAQHFAEVCSQQEFVQLPLNEVVQLLCSDDLNITSEKTIVQAVMSWLEHDLPGRRLHCATVLGLVRLPLLQPQYISDTVENSELFRDDIRCQQLIMEALKHHLNVPMCPLFAGDDVVARARPRKSTVGTLYLVGGMDASKAPVEVLQYNYRNNSWKVQAQFPSSHTTTSSTVGAGGGGSRRLQCGGGVVAGKLHVVGGRDGLKTLNTVESWDHTTGHWSHLPNMATHRHGLGVGVVGGVVYSVGGHDGWSYLNTVERWDPGARVWTYVAPMSTPRSSLGVAVLNGKLYAVGGRDGSSCLRSVECYDPHTNRWTPCAPMQRRRGGVGVGVLHGYLYAVGGHDAPASSPTVNRLDCLERYDPGTDSWSLVSPGLGVGCDSAAVCQLGDLLVCVGGYTGTCYLQQVQAYNPLDATWTQLAPLPTGRAGACTVVIR
uniref:Kelch-like protein 5 n=1 Tax=Hirondellea gigas TaxID=1518452 RepID=A0A2P2HW93_9CRUS